MRQERRREVEKIYKNNNHDNHNASHCNSW